MIQNRKLEFDKEKEFDRQSKYSFKYLCSYLMSRIKNCSDEKIRNEKLIHDFRIKLDL